MGMHTDQWGLPVTAAGDAAVTAFDATISTFLAFGRDTGDRLKDTFKADPDMPMAHCLKGYFLHLLGTAAMLPRAGQALASAEAGAGSATPRERAHVAALGAWCAGDMTAAVKAWKAILADHPLDVLALKLAHYVDFYLGNSKALRDTVANSLGAWSKDVPGYGYILGMHAFALEETGDYKAAEDAGRRAVAINPADSWAVHAVAHVMEMQDRRRDGVDWIRGLESHWNACNNFRYHLWWHLALMLLELGRYDEVLALYDDDLWDEDSNEYLDLVNDTSLLLRLELHGIPVGDRWQALAGKVRDRAGEHILTFVDAHFMMALAAAGGDAADGMLASLKDYAGAGKGTNAAVSAAVGLPVCRALLAHRRGQYAEAADLLAPIRDRIHRMGGSHAQRDIFAQVLVDAATRGGRLDLARLVLDERLAANPGNAWNWRALAAVLGVTGDTVGAEKAAHQAADLRKS
jgi:tetratricopeptide (TPR) repeat protein